MNGKARLPGGGKADERTVQNKADRAKHATALSQAAGSAATQWEQQQRDRPAASVQSFSAGVPLLLQIDPSLDLDALKAQLNIEIVSEQSGGFVIVATEDFSLTKLQAKIADFSAAAKGSAVVASVYEIHAAGSAARIAALSEWLAEKWPTIKEDGDYVVDVGVECVGTSEFRERPSISDRKPDESDVAWAKREARYQRKLAEWSEGREAVYVAWDELKSRRELEVRRFVGTYRGEIEGQWEASGIGGPPDSFTMRLRIKGKGLKDLVLNYPYIFEVVEPDDVLLPQHEFHPAAATTQNLELAAPRQEAPAVGIIDSGVQEGHRLLSRAIDASSSFCLLPGATSVADEVAPNGHGTRVAGIVLFGEQVPSEGKLELPFWIRNVRVLDASNCMPRNLAPQRAIRDAIIALRPKGTRIFNHSINARGPCRQRHMSSWAAEIDMLSYEFDVLVVQSSGNIPPSSAADSSYVGVADHLSRGRDYPAFLSELSSRIANPAQSLQALTVGSVGYGSFEGDGWKSFVARAGDVSAFSRCGPGIWDLNKPDVVEFGGDYLQSMVGEVANVGVPAVGRDCYPELLRATLKSIGDPTSRDTVGTSFTAPKVTRIAAHVQSVLPEESTLLYRALVVQSARWPDHALDLVAEHESEKTQNQKLRAREGRAAKREMRAPNAVDNSRERLLASQLAALFRQIGYGVPDLQRATRNDESRVTLITAGDRTIAAGACDIYEVRVPAGIRAPGNDYDVMVEVTLSYAAVPRRTRRTLKRYLSVWLDWTTNKAGQSLEDFRKTALVETDATPGVSAEDELDESSSGTGLRWMLSPKDDNGITRGISRNGSTIQKDWAVTKLHQLSESFCIAVRGHKGWSRDPEAAARYSLVVSFEVLGGEVAIYEEVRVEIDSEVLVDEVRSS